MTIIETAARALCRAEFAHRFGPRAVLSENYLDRQWGQHVAQARAAIQAIREPDDAMLAAGWRCQGSNAPGSIWKAMIDSLLTVDPHHATHENGTKS